MSTARGLHKQIDADVLARVLNKTPRPQEPTIKRQTPPRHGSTYRQARRNAVLREGTRGTWGKRHYYKG